MDNPIGFKALVYDQNSGFVYSPWYYHRWTPGEVTKAVCMDLECDVAIPYVNQAHCQRKERYEKYTKRQTGPTCGIWIARYDVALSYMGPERVMVIGEAGGVCIEGSQAVSTEYFSIIAVVDCSMHYHHFITKSLLWTYTEDAVRQHYELAAEYLGVPIMLAGEARAMATLKEEKRRR